MSNIIWPFHDHRKKSPPPWTNIYTNIIKKVKSQVKCLPCLHILNPFAYKIIEIDSFDIRYDGIS